MSETSSQPAAESADEQAIAVRSFWIPLQDTAMLLPNTAVAEVADFELPRSMDGAPPWLLGMLPWRGRSIPLISFERLLGRAMDEPHRHCRVAVVNTLNHNPELPFIGMLSQGIPRLLQLRNGMLEAQPRSEDDDAVVMARVSLDEAEALIPELDVLERVLMKHGISAS